MRRVYVEAPSAFAASRDLRAKKLDPGREQKMVAGCPKCSARYRVDAERIGPDGAKLRCTKCSAVFLVRSPRGAAKAARESAPAEAVKPTTPPSAPPEATSPVDRERLVIVADADETRGKATAEALRGWGLSPHVVLDGVEAMLAIQRMLPRAVVLDAGLPKMFGFQVCEVVKRNESLRETTVVLIGAIHDQDRYRRDPSDLYGADVYIEQPDLPDGLLPILREAGLPVQEREADLGAASPPSPEPAPVVAPSSTPDAGPRPVAEAPTSAPAPAAASSASAVDGDPALAEERERARRLARIAVSEMLLYQPEKFEQAIVDGNIEQVLGLEIQEAQALLRQRIGEEVRSETDFVMDELRRVAAERS